MITKSLSEALPVLSKYCFTGYFLIDQVCINQAHILERNHQVKIMGDVFRRASKVLVYVGGVPPVLSFLVLYSGSLKTPSPAKKSLTQLQGSLEAYMVSKQKHWNAVVQLLGAAWFTRASCFQEVTLATEPVFAIGNEVVTFDVLFRLALAMSRIETTNLVKVLRDKCVTIHHGFHRFYAMDKDGTYYNKRAVLPCRGDAWRAGHVVEGRGCGIYSCLIH
jgi:hypothetical protein